VTLQGLGHEASRQRTTAVNTAGAVESLVGTACQQETQLLRRSLRHRDNVEAPAGKIDAPMSRPRPESPRLGKP
jgi:hypothetical protein